MSYQPYYLYRPDPAKPRHRQLMRLVLAVRDISLAADALGRAASLDENDDTREILIGAAVVYYARSFTSGRNWSSVSTKWAKFDDPRHRETHGFVSAWRNSVVAHNDEQLNEVEFMPKGSFVEFRPHGSSESVNLTMSNHGERLLSPKFPAEALVLFQELCHFQLGRLEPVVNGEKDALWSEFLKPQKRG